MHCAHCRQAITGRYMRVGKLAFHPEHFLCRACQSPIQGSFQVFQGAFLHPACYEAKHAPRCAVCTQPLVGRHVVHEGKPMHDVCYGKHFAKQCDLCRRMIVGAYVTDYWGHTYHAEHTREFAECMYCGKLVHPAISGGGTTYPDKRAVCRGCHKTAVHRDADGQRVVASVRARMAGWGVDLGNLVVPVRLIDRNQLSTMLKGGPHASMRRVSGFAGMTWEAQGKSVQNKKASIYLLNGMPLSVLEATAAHELMHVWNFFNGPRHAFALEEGSCNYMSYRVHEAQGGELADYHIDCLMKDPDPAYGEGFRKVKRYADRHGFERLLTMLQRSSDFPVLGGLF
ncbi:MAG: protein DA1 [Candidatus Sericytochromatia bacterium]